MVSVVVVTSYKPEVSVVILAGDVTSEGPGPVTLLLTVVRSERPVLSVVRSSTQDRL